MAKSQADAAVEVSNTLSSVDRGSQTTITEQEDRQIRGLRWVLIVASILTSTFLFGLDNTIVADVQPDIIIEFDSVDKLPWLSVALLIGAASTTLFWGQMYGVCNSKWLYIICVTIFEIGSAVCGGAPSIDALIIGRAICGIGGTGLYTGVLTLLSTLTDVHERASYIGLTGLTWGTGTVIGPIIGGAFASSSAGWRWSFYINLVMAGVCAPIYIFLIPSLQSRDPTSSFIQRLRRIDFAGTILLIGVFVSGLMAISFGNVLYPWNSGTIIALFVVSGVLAAAFLAQQIIPLMTTVEKRSFPCQFFKDRSLVIILFLECCASTLTYIPVYFIPLFFQFVREDSALEAGVHTLPLVLFLVVTIILNGFIISANGRYMPWFLIGSILGLVGSVLLYTVDLDTSNARIYGYCILAGTGAGCFLQLPFSVVQSLVAPEAIPSAIGFVTFGQLGAPSVMLAIANAVFLNEASNSIAAVLPSIPRQTITSILSGVGSDVYNKLDDESKHIILQDIVAGLNKGYIITMTLCALSIILSLFLSKKKMFDSK